MIVFLPMGGLNPNMYALYIVAVLFLLSSGCNLSDSLVKTTIIEPVQFSNYWDEKRERHHFRALAKQELETARATARAELDDYQCNPFSIDEERGFEDGFVDTLLYGSRNSPPAMPPRRYWRLKYQNLEGYHAIEDWYKGYQHGAAVAQASGIRDFVVVNTNGALIKETLPIYPDQLADLEEIEPAEKSLDETTKQPTVERAPRQARWPSEESIRNLAGRTPSQWSSVPSEPIAQENQPLAESAPVGNSTPWSSQTEKLPSRVPGYLPTESQNQMPADAPDSSRSVRPLPPFPSGEDGGRPLNNHSFNTNSSHQSVPHPMAAAPVKLHSSSPTSVPILVNLMICSATLLVWRASLLWIGRQRAYVLARQKLVRLYVRSRSRLQLILSRIHARRIHGHDDTRATETIGFSMHARLALLMVLASALTSGCAALTNPVLNGIPVRRLPTELLTSSRREHLQTVPLSMLQQEGPKDYVLGPGDVIGVFIPGVFPLTLDNQALPTPPVYFPSQIDPLGQGLPPSLGYPLTIQNNGTLNLPLVDPLLLEGLTVEEANQRVRDAFEEKGILQPGRESVVVTLMQPRQVRVLVFRQEVGGFSAGGRGDISSNNVKQGTGHLVDLRAYENDVLTALARTGGLPGLDAFDGIFIFRGGQSNTALTEKLRSLKSDEDLSTLSGFGVPTDYIPTRWAPGEPLPFEPEDVVLNEGDVVLVESRAKDFFYTGGLLPVGEQVLPRDYDLDVLEAVAQVNGTLINGAFGGNNFTGVLIQQGIGNPNPSALTVIRRTPSGGTIPIRVDLNRALTDPRERIIVQPDDVLILQETTGETFGRYLNDIFNFNFTIFQRGATGAGAATTGN